MNDLPPDPKRSALMSRVHAKNTRPEILTRQAAHALGYRFRLHRRDLPGTPDMVFPKLRKVIFVHGCFWHRHPGCQKASTPKSRADFWQAKFEANVLRDQRNENALRNLGWYVLIVWECETVDQQALGVKLSKFLGVR